MSPFSNSLKKSLQLIFKMFYFPSLSQHHPSRYTALTKAISENNLPNCAPLPLSTPSPLPICGFFITLIVSSFPSFSFPSLSLSFLFIYSNYFSLFFISVLFRMQRVFHFLLLHILLQPLLPLSVLLNDSETSEAICFLFSLLL